ncbi:unnamed protein product [Alternaria alternata]
MSAFLVPSIIVRFNLEQRVKALNLWQDKIYWNERRIGIRFDHYDNPELSSIDFSTLSKDLNAVNTNLAFIVLLCKSTTRMLEFLDQVARRYKRQADNNGVPEDESTEIKQLLLDTNSELRSWNVGLEDRAEYVSKRGQALVQTKEREVMAALITPKEEQGTDPVAFDQRPTELELDQFVEQESGNVARRATTARLRTGLDWTKSITQQKTAHGQGEPSA